MDETSAGLGRTGWNDQTRSSTHIFGNFCDKLSGAFGVFWLSQGVSKAFNQLFVLWFNFRKAGTQSYVIMSRMSHVHSCLSESLSLSLSLRVTYSFTYAQRWPAGGRTGSIPPALRSAGWGDRWRSSRWGTRPGSSPRKPERRTESPAPGTRSGSAVGDKIRF